MEGKSLEERVTLLENELRGVPDRIGTLETQVTAVVLHVAELREEMSSMRGEMTSLRGEMTAMRGDMSSLRGEMTSMRDELRKEIKDGDDETRRLMRVLHEDLVARIALIDRG